MRTRSLALLAVLSLSTTAAACAPSDEDADSSEAQVSKLKAFWADAKKLDLNDLTRVTVGFASDQLSNALSSGNNGIEIEKPEVFSLTAEPNKVLPNEFEVKSIEAITSGLAAEFGERELGTEVNALRRRTLEAGKAEAYVESGFTVKAGIKHDWSFDASFANNAKFTLGIDTGVALTSRVVIAAPPEPNDVNKVKLKNLVAAPLEAAKGLRGFIYPRSVEDVRKLEPGEMFALRGAGKFGGNFGLGVPLVQGAIVASMGVAGVISGQLDVQLVKLDNNKVIVDVGVENGKAVSFRAAITDGFGIKGSCEDEGEKFPCLSEQDLGNGIKADIAKAAEKAVLKKLEKHILLNIGGGVSKESTRVSLTRFRFDLSKDNPEVEKALQQALKFDVRLAQALYNRDLDQANPPVVAEFDAMRAATTSTRNFGFQLLGMSIYHKNVVKREGSFVLQTPDGVKSILFDTEHTDRNVFQKSDGKKVTGLSAQTLDARNPDSFRSEANLFLQVVSGDSHMNNDFVIDNCDATLLGVLGDKGPAAIAELDKFGNAMQAMVLDQCNGGSDDSCSAALLDRPEMIALKKQGNDAIDPFIQGLPADFQNLTKKMVEVRMSLQSIGIHRGTLAQNGPRVSFTFDLRLDDKALDILTSKSKAEYTTALRNYLTAIVVERKNPNISAADKQAQFDAESKDEGWESGIQKMADAFEANRQAYRTLVNTEKAVNEALAGKRFVSYPLAIRFPVTKDAVSAIENATIDSISNERAKAAEKLYNGLLDAASKVDDEPLFNQHTAVYPLAALLPRENMDVAIALRAQVKSGAFQNRERFVKAGFESTVGISQPFISSNHGHALIISWKDLDRAEAKSYSIKGSASHDHTFTLTNQQIQDVNNGRQVIVETSIGDGHKHQVTVAHAGDVRATGSQVSTIRAGMFDIDAILNGN